MDYSKQCHMGFSNRLVFFGTSRGGNHCIINSIMSQCPRPAVFKNCVNTRMSYVGPPPPTLGCETYIYINTDKKVRVPYISRRGNELIDGEGPYKLTFVQSYGWSYENVKCEDIYSHENKLQFPEPKYIFIVRDYLNQLASQVASKDSSESIASMSETWLHNVKRILLDKKDVPESLITVLYNDWVKDPRYRQSVVEGLGLNFTDEGSHSVISQSSFDKAYYDGYGLMMTSNRRFDQIWDEPEYQKEREKHKECLEVSEQIFGDVTKESFTEELPEGPTVDLEEEEEEEPEYDPEYEEEFEAESLEEDKDG